MWFGPVEGEMMTQAAGCDMTKPFEREVRVAEAGLGLWRMPIRYKLYGYEVIIVQSVY